MRLCAHIGGSLCHCVCVFVHRKIYGFFPSFTFMISNSVILFHVFVFFYRIDKYTAGVSPNKTFQTTYRIIDATCKLPYKTSGNHFICFGSLSMSLLHIIRCVRECVCVWFFMWFSFSIRCVFHYQISETGNHRRQYPWVCRIPYCLRFPSFAHFVFQLRLALCVNFDSYRFLLQHPHRMDNDGIMIIVAKVANDLKCDNVCFFL